MELFDSLLPLIVFVLVYALKHYYIKDSRKRLKKILKIVFSKTISFIFILVLGMEFGCMPKEF